jgi:rod shape-determining protein MreB and related proteins
MAQAGSQQDKVLLVGIDLGTSRSVISAANGKREWVESYVGWPKDFVARKVLGKRLLFGADALEHRLSLDLYRPLERGVIKEGTAKGEEAVGELVSHLIDLGSAGDTREIYAVLGVPSEAMKVNKMALRKAVAGKVHGMMVVSDPFAVAYGQGMLDNALVIDIGAGTTDFCIMHGAVPGDEDQATLLTAGDYIDQQLYHMLREKYPESNFTLHMIRHFKEKHAFVGQPDGAVKVEMPVEGKAVVHDITDEMRRACESIMPPMVEAAADLIARFDPEYQSLIRGSIALAGGGSQIRGIAAYLEDALKEYGPCTAKCVDDPLFAGADGALGLAKDMPQDYWEKV